MQENSWNLHDPDAIPGWTTFIYKENRFRRKNEYVNAEKIEIREKKELLLEIECLEEEKESKEKEVSRLVEKNFILKEELKKKDKQLAEAFLANTTITNQLQAREALLMKAKTENNNLKDTIREFGDHLLECRYTEAIQSGRILKKSAEKTLCNCGWHELKLTL